MSDREYVRRRLVISGLVQGVGFRVSVANEAKRAGVVGSVRNLEDGRVEAVLQGPMKAVQQIEEWCRHGPAFARVREIEVTDERLAMDATFVIVE
jgi:acylphosphatase